MMIKRVVLSLLGVCLLSITCFADTVSLYGNIDDSSNICNMLVDIMVNDEAYDPYNQYAVFRAGENDYRIYFGKDLKKNNLVYYRYIPASYGYAATIQRGIADSLTINKNGYYYVGNTHNTLASASFESYKVGAVISIGVVVILIFILFRTFRKSQGNKVHYYKVK